MFAYCNNNPIVWSDPSGMYAALGKLDDQFCATSTLDGGSGGILGRITPIIVDTAAIVIAAAVTLEATTQERPHHVYVLTDPSNDDIVKYVGRTNDPGRRMREHKRDINHPERANYEMKVVASGLTLEKAKLVEQAFISAFTLAYLENARREIAVGKLDKYHQYIGAATEIFVGATEDGLWALLKGG